MGVAGRNAYRTLGGKCLNGLMQAHGGRACFSETAVVAVWRGCTVIGDREAVFTRKVRRVLVLAGVGERSFVCWKPGYVTPLQGFI